MHLGQMQQIISMIIARPELRELAMLYLAAYTIQLRLPSEGLPLAAHEDVLEHELAARVHLPLDRGVHIFSI